MTVEALVALFTIVAANCDKERGGTLRYIRFLWRLAGRPRWWKRLARKTPPAVLALTEVGHGRRSTRLRARGVRVRNRRRVEIGTVGVHRWAAVGDLRLAGILTTAWVVHALHFGTLLADAQASARRRGITDPGWAERQARQVQLTFLETLAGMLVGDWWVAGDLNLGGRRVAEILGGVWIGDGVDGIIVSKSLYAKLVAAGVVLDLKTDTTGKDDDLTDHPAIKVTGSGPRPKPAHDPRLADTGTGSA